MAASFAERVTSPAWQRSAELWILDRVAQSGAEVTGPIAQPRVRPWSTQLVVPTTQGRWWFKANCPGLAFEPALHETLARLEPDEVDEPFAVDVDRGWLLTRDRGATLSDDHEPTVSDWKSLLTTAAQLQRRLADHAGMMLRSGLPDCSPHTVPTRYELMIDRLAVLPTSHPSHLPAASADRLRSARAVVTDAVATLSDGPLPVSLQHGDLHPGNVFVVDGALRLFDFGDAQWAHALEILAVPWGWITKRTALPWPEVFAAYASGWADLADPAGLEPLLAAAMVTHAVNRSATWWEAIADATPDELTEWGDSPKYFLELALEPFEPVASQSS